MRATLHDDSQEIQAYPDTEKFTAYLARLAAGGVEEAAAPPIED